MELDNNTNKPNFYNPEDFSEGTIKFSTSNTEFVPMWAVNHYLKTIAERYYKMVNVVLIADLLVNYPDAKLFISTESSPLEADNNDYYDALYRMVDAERISYDNDPVYFMDLFNKKERPLVYAQINGTQVLLYNPMSSVGFKLKEMSFNSPISGVATGIPSVLVDVFFSGAKYELEKKEHEKRLEIIEKEDITENYYMIEAAAKSAEALNKMDISDGIRAYLQQSYDNNMRKMQDINKKNGVCIISFDKRI